MTLGAEENDRQFQSPRCSAVSTESGIELSQSSPEQDTQNYSGRNSMSSRPCIDHNLDSRQILDARNENGTISASNAVENLNSDQRRKFSRIISKLARHPWTESTELVELWSDIPGKTVDPNQTCQEQKNSRENGTSVSFLANSNNGSRISWVLSKHPWTVSTKLVEPCCDVPNEFDTNRNRSEDRGELMDQNEATHLPNATTFSKHIPDKEQCLATTTGIFRNSFPEFEKLAAEISITPEDSISNRNYSMHSEQNKIACCSVFSECLREFQNFSISFRTEIFVLVMKILLSLIPISAFFMGAIHIGTCPANEWVTHLVYITGISGVFLIGLCISYHFTIDLKKEKRKGIKTFQTITAILLILEMIIFYSMSPSFEHSENYCDKIFYNYTFYMNIAAAGIVFLSILLQYTCKHLVDNEGC